MDNRPDQSGSNYGGYRSTPGIRRKILIPLGLTLAVIVSSALYSLIALQNHNADENLSQKLVQIEKSFQDILDDDTDLIKVLLDRVADNPKIQKAWQSKNREQLLRRCLPLFDEYNSKYRITHFYFHDLDRYCFLRVHNPERYGDSIIRYTMTESGQSGMISSGIELGPLGTFTLRVVAPWRIDGELVGYLELGEEIEHITDQLTQMYDVKLIFTVEKKFLDRSGWENGLRVMGKEGDWDRFDDIVAIDHSLSHLPYNLVSLLNSWPELQNTGFPEVRFNDRMYRFGLTGLYDVSRKKMGSIVMLVDFSEESAYLSRFTIILLGLGCIAGVFCFWFFNMILARLESRLKNTHRKLVEEIDIRKRTEKLLSFTKYSIDNIAVSAFWVDRKGGFIYVNPAACQYLGYSEQELLQMKVWDVAPEFPQDIWGEHWQQMQKVRQLKVETVQKHRSGKVSPIEASLNYVECEGKQSIVAFISDISERIKSENELKRINLFLKETQRIATVGGWELDLDSKEFYLTDEVYKILDYPSEKLITMQDAVSLCHPDYLDTLKETLDNAIAHGKPYDLRLRYKTYKGRDIWIRAIGRKSVSEDKRTVLHGTLQDITAQKLWEQKIKASEEKFRMLLQKATDGIVIHTSQGEFLVVNDRMHNSLGYTREEFMRLKLPDILLPEIAEEVPSRLEELKAKGNTVFESVHVKKDGSIMPVEVASQEIVFEGQTAYLSIVRDITQRKKSEETIKAQLQFMSTLIETIPNPIFYKDRRGVYLGCNRAFADQILGLDKEDIIGATVYDLPMQIPTKLADDYHSQDLRLIQSGGYQVYESKVKCADGVEREFHFSKACYKDAGGDTAGLVGVMLDLTERRKIEKALRESESKYRGIYDNAQIGLFRTTIEEGQVIECNARFAEILGYPSVESCIRNCVLSSMYVDTRDRQRMVAELQQTGRISNYEAQFVNNVGKTKWIRYSARFLKEMNCLEGVAVEISEEKEALEMQHKSSQQVVNILASISDGFYILNDDLQITYFNKAAEEILGKSSDQVFGRNLFKTFPEFENSFLQESYRVAVREKKQMSFEIPLIVNGREDWFDIRVYPFEEGISVYFQSILERKRFEQVLKEKEYKLQSTLDTAADGIIVIDSYGMIDTFNPAVERMFGYMIEEVKNKNISTLIPDLLKKVIYPTLAETAENKDL
ncbi:MAG: PAS domain S-box protein, partial [candidate division Zixibacteria bacterium]|nr:PAS domain S-box protein [candidate division Zixibacteria bacterium]